MSKFDKYISAIDDIEPLTYMGYIEKIIGLTIESNGPAAQIGEICHCV